MSEKRKRCCGYYCEEKLVILDYIKCGDCGELTCYDCSDSCWDCGKTLCFCCQWPKKTTIRCGNCYLPEDMREPEEERDILSPDSSSINNSS